MGHSLYDPALMAGAFHPKVIVYYFKQWEDFQMPFHSHAEIEIMYVISGQCVVETETQLISMKKGDFIVLDANTMHRLIVAKPHQCRMINVEFQFTDEGQLFPSLKELVNHDPTLFQLFAKNAPYFVLKDSNEVYHTLKNLVLELDKNSVEAQMMIHLLFAQLMIQIARLAGEAGEAGHQQADVYVKRAIAYLHHHYDCDIRMKDIASVVCIHPGYLHRIFKASMGCTVMDYLTTLRLEKAKMLLTQTNIPVMEISDSVGINSSQYFSAVFKKHTGQTPIEYRKSFKIRRDRTELESRRVTTAVRARSTKG